MNTLSIYATVYFMVLLFTFILEIITKKNDNPRNFIILSIIPIFVLSIFASVRDFSVGTDIQVYGLSSFRNTYSFTNLISYLKFYSKEPLYYFLNYICSRISTNYHFFLFVLQFISSVILYKILYDYRHKISVTFMVFCYLTIWYNTSFNILRQTTAVMIIIYAFKYLKNNNSVKYIICVIVASLFHVSALVCFFNILLQYISKFRNRKLYYFISTVGLIMAVIFINELFNLILSKVSIFSKYQMYIHQDANIRIPYLIVKIVILLFLFLFSVGIFGKIKNKEIELLLNLGIIDSILYFSSAFVKFGYRLSYFYLPHLIILIPEIQSNIKIRTNRLIFTVVSVFLLLFQWYVRYFVIMYDGVVPYIFS